MFIFPLFMFIKRFYVPQKPYQLILKTTDLLLCSFADILYLMWKQLQYYIEEIQVNFDFSVWQVLVLYYFLSVHYYVTFSTQKIIYYYTSKRKWRNNALARNGTRRELVTRQYMYKLPHPCSTAVQHVQSIKNHVLYTDIFYQIWFRSKILSLEVEIC